MTLNELSVEFDILYNNILSDQAPGLTEYEKSVFLTQAQENVILGIYNGTLADSFESTEAVTRYISNLVKTKIISKFTESTSPITSSEIKEVDIEDPKLWFITYEAVKQGGKDTLVTPVTQDEFYNICNNPFKGPRSNNRVLRLSIGNDKVELVGAITKDSSYIVRYISRPYPIILDYLDGDLTIEGETEPRELEVPESLHRLILLKAIELAKATWAS